MPVRVLHHGRKPVEQTETVLRTGTCLRVELYRKSRKSFRTDAAIAAVEQRDMRLGDIARQGLAVDRKTVIHRHHRNPPGGQIPHGMVGTVMAVVHLYGVRAKCAGQELVAEADAKNWYARFQDFLHRNCHIDDGTATTANSPCCRSSESAFCFLVRDIVTRATPDYGSSIRTHLSLSP